jgi:hypothetical protein
MGSARTPASLLPHAGTVLSEPRAQATSTMQLRRDRMPPRWRLGFGHSSRSRRKCRGPRVLRPGEHAFSFCIVGDRPLPDKPRM